MMEGYSVVNCNAQLRPFPDLVLSFYAIGSVYCVCFSQTNFVCILVSHVIKENASGTLYYCFCLEQGQTVDSDTKNSQKIRRTRRCW